MAARVLLARLCVARSSLALNLILHVSVNLAIVARGHVHLVDHDSLGLRASAFVDVVWPRRILQVMLQTVSFAVLLTT